MKLENLSLLAKIFCLKKEGQTWKFIAQSCNITVSKARHLFRYNQKTYDDLFGSVGQLEESEVLRTLQCGFESHRAHQNISYSKPSKENLVDAVKKSYNYSDVLRKLSLDPENNNHRRKIYSLIRVYNIDVSHLEKKRNPETQCKFFDPKKPQETIFIANSLVSGTVVKRYLYKLGLKQKVCEVCNIENWNDKPISLELHHVNGDSADHRIENLKIMCPNCHSQTHNFKGKNKKI